MSEATELRSPGCANDKRSPGGIKDRRILDCAIDDMRSSGCISDMCPVDKFAPGGPEANGEIVRLRSMPSGTKDNGLEPGSSDTVAR